MEETDQAYEKCNEVPESFGDLEIDTWYKNNDVFETLRIAEIVYGENGRRRSPSCNAARRNLFQIIFSVKENLSDLEKSVSKYKNSSTLSMCPLHDRECYALCKQNFMILVHRLCIACAFK